MAKMPAIPKGHWVPVDPETLPTAKLREQYANLRLAFKEASAARNRFNTELARVLTKAGVRPEPADEAKGTKARLVKGAVPEGKHIAVGHTFGRLSVALGQGAPKASTTGEIDLAALVDDDEGDED